MPNKEAKEALKYLHDRWVLISIDKKNGNVTLICKNFYVLILFRERCKNAEHMNMLRMLVMTLFLKDILIIFSDSFEFLFKEVIHVYHQFIGYLRCIRIQPMLYL